MVAYSSILQPSAPDLADRNEQVFVVSRKGLALPAPSTPNEIARRPCEGPEILAYAAFVLDQEARYCQS